MSYNGDLRKLFAVFLFSGLNLPSQLLAVVHCNNGHPELCGAHALPTQTSQPPTATEAPGNTQTILPGIALYPDYQGPRNSQGYPVPVTPAQPAYAVPDQIAPTDSSTLPPVVNSYIKPPQHIHTEVLPPLHEYSSQTAFPGTAKSGEKTKVGVVVVRTNPHAKKPHVSSKDNASSYQAYPSDQSNRVTRLPGRQTLYSPAAFVNADNSYSHCLVSGFGPRLVAPENSDVEGLLSGVLSLLDLIHDIPAEHPRTSDCLMGLKRLKH